MKNKLFYAEYHVTEYISDTCTLKQLDYLQLFYITVRLITLAYSVTSSLMDTVRSLASAC